MIITRSEAVLSPQRYHLPLLASLDPIFDKVVVIVPEQYTLQAERDLMAGLKAKGLFHIEVTSFKRIWHRLLKQFGYKEGEVLTDLGKKMVLRQVLYDLNDNLKLYRGAYRNKGFLDDLATTVNDLRQNAVAPEYFQALAALAPQSTLFSTKLSELSAVYGAYVGVFSNAVYDESYMVERVIEGLNSQTPTLEAQTRTYYIVEGFSSMTMQEIELLCALSNHAKEMAVRLVDVPSDTVCLRYPKRLFDQLVKTFTARGVGVEVVLESSPTPYGSKLFRGLFEEDFSAPDGAQKGEFLVLGQARDRYEELSWALLDMVKHHEDHGVPWEDMAILTNDLEAYSGMGKRLFKEYQIPGFIDKKRPALTHTAIDFVMTSLRAVMSGYRAAEVLKVLKTGFELPFEAVCRIENFALAVQLRGKRWLGPFVSEDLQDLEVYRQRVMEPLELLKTHLMGAVNGQEMVVGLRDYLRAVGMLEQLEGGVLAAKQEGDFERAEEMAQIHNIIDHVLFQIYTLGSRMPVDLGDFFDLMKLGFESYEIGVIPPARHFVTMGNIARTRLGDIQRLYIVGVNEGVMPSKVEGKGLFLEDEMQWLVDQGVAKMRSTLYLYDEEVYKTYEHLLRVRGCVWLTYGRFSTEGMALKPSLWINQLMAMGLSLQDLVVEDEDLYRLGLAVPFVARGLVGLGVGEVPDEGLLMARLKGLMALGSQEQGILRYLQGMVYHNQPEDLPQGVAGKLYGETLRTSVTRLESFSKCPYQHFARYALKPQTRPTPDLTGLDMGDLFHNVLEDLMNALKLEEKPITDAVWDRLFEEIYQEKCAANERFSLNAKNIYYSSRLKAVLRGAVAHVVAHINGSQFVNYKNELVFGVGLAADAPPLVIETGQGERVMLEGKIDRLDVLDQDNLAYLSIVDYKSSAQSLGLSDVYHGLKLQLMLYLDVALAHGETLFGKTAEPFGAFYFKVDEPMVSAAPDADEDQVAREILEAFQLEGLCLNDPTLIGKADAIFEAEGRGAVVSAKLNKSGDLASNKQLLDKESLDTVMQFAKAKASAIAQAIYGGNLAIEPVKEGQRKTCDYCDFKGICHFDDKKYDQEYKSPAALDNETTLTKMKEVLTCHGPQNKTKPSI